MTVDPQALERRKRFDKDTQDMVAWVQSPNPATAHDFASMDP
jgi:hypothetical protein